MLCVRLNRGNISPAPLTEVGQADAYIKQLQVKCSSLYSETAKIFLALWLKDSAGGAAGAGGWGVISALSPHKRETSPQKCRECRYLGVFSHVGLNCSSAQNKLSGSKG